MPPKRKQARAPIKKKIKVEYDEIITPKKLNYNCNECPKKFTFRKSFTQHLLNEHSKTPGSVSCKQCKVQCPNKEVLMEHVNKVHERDVYKCPHCDKQFVRLSHVTRHKAQKGCGGRVASSFPCDICNATFTRRDNLIMHLRYQHINLNAWMCKQCAYSTKNFSKLVKHWHKYHSGTPDLYECHHCSKSTSSRAAMAKHLEIHGDKKFSCDVCGYKTFTVEVMKRHELTHVEDKPYKCTLCKRSYIQRLQLDRHLKKHMGHMCLICGEKFTSESKMIIHKRGHMGLEKLLCPFEDCSYSKKEFGNEAALETHLKIHLEKSKSFSCEVCGKKFHAEVNMRRHLATHTLDRPRRCMYCVSARAYVRGEQLVRHVRNAHPLAFRDHLNHVRDVLDQNYGVERVKKSEMESILNLLDAEADRILEGYGGSGILYGGMQENICQPNSSSSLDDNENENSPLMSEETLVENLKKLLSKLIDLDTLECFGWPEESIDVVLEKVIEQCGAKSADREKWSRVQCLRENTKHLFLYAIDDKNVASMLDTHTIDQIVKHILKQVSGDDEEDK